MSISVTFGQKWEACKLFLLNPAGAATGTINVGGVNNELLTCYAPMAESSKATRYVTARAGEKIKVTCQARLVSGTQGSVGIDFPSAGNLHVVDKVTSKEWATYQCEMIIPQTANENSVATIQIGSYGADDGTIEFLAPTVTKSNVQLGTSQALAMGMIYFDTADSNTPKINKGFSFNGIYSLSYDAGAKELTIAIPRTQRDDPEGAIDTESNPRIPVRPLFFGSVVFDNGGAGLNVQFSDYVYTTGELKARFYDATGTLIDITTLLGGGNIYFNFKAEVN